MGQWDFFSSPPRCSTAESGPCRLHPIRGRTWVLHCIRAISLDIVIIVEDSYFVGPSAPLWTETRPYRQRRNANRSLALPIVSKCVVVTGWDDGSSETRHRDPTTLLTCQHGRGALREPLFVDENMHMKHLIHACCGVRTALMPQRGRRKLPARSIARTETEVGPFFFFRLGTAMFRLR